MKKKSENNLGLQTTKFSEKVGLTTRQVLNYCDLNVFNPVRPADAANERRYFTETDFKVAELIHILEKLGHGPKEIAKTFELKSHDLDLILESAITDVKKRIIHDRNLVLAAEFAQSVGTSLFSFGSMTDSDIDRFASAVRKTNSYKRSNQFFRELSPAEREALLEHYDNFMRELASLASLFDDDAQLFENFFKIEALVDDFVSMNSKITGEDTPHASLFFGAMFLSDDGILCQRANAIGGPDASESIGMCFVMAWIKQMSCLIFPLINLLTSSQADNAKTNTVLEELFSLFYVSPLIITAFSTQQEGYSDRKYYESMFDLVFELVKDFSTDPDLLQILQIKTDILPTAAQFDQAKTLLAEYVNTKLERREN